MKKILYLTILSMSTSVCMSQSLTSSVPNDAKKMTIAEANALNGTAIPTINGKPYSQYKAEQDALKNKQEAVKTNSISPGSVTLGGTENLKPIDAPQKAAITKASPVDAKPVDAKGGTSLEVKPVAENIKPSTEDKAAPSSVTPVAKPKVSESKQGGN